MVKTYQSKYGTKENTDLLTILKTFPTHFKAVVSSLSWLFITLSITSALLIVSGMTAFAPKYLESQFGVTASTASLAVGAVGECVVCVCVCVCAPYMYLMYQLMDGSRWDFGCPCPKPERHGQSSCELLAWFQEFGLHWLTLPT